MKFFDFFCVTVSQTQTLLDTLLNSKSLSEFSFIYVYKQELSSVLKWQMQHRHLVAS